MTINKINTISTCDHTVREMELTEREKDGACLPLPEEPGGGHEGLSYEKKIEKGVFPLGEETGKNAPLHFYCSGLTQIGH